MPKNALPLPPLSDAQKSAVALYWYESPHDLLARVWPDRPELTLRNIEWKAARKYLASLDPSTLPPAPPPPREPLPPLLREPQNPVPPELMGEDEDTGGVPAAQESGNTDPFSDPLGDPLGEPLDSELEGAESPREPVPPTRPAPFRPRTEGANSVYNHLTAEQQQFITENYKQASGPLELARTLFENPKLMPGHRECQLVAAYIRKIDPGYRRYDEPTDSPEYNPPKTIVQLAGKLNRYGIGARPDGKMLFDGNKFTAQEQRQLEALLRYMNRPTFKVKADQFGTKIDREVFEENFMSMCWDKPDLTPEYVLQYIMLAGLNVEHNRAQRTARKLTERFEAALEDPSKALSKSEVDGIKNTASTVEETLKQMNALIKTLQGDRARKEEARKAGASSMHPLVQAFRTREGRERAIALAKRYNEELRGEVNRLAGMDALKAELAGLDPNAILH